MTGQCLQFSRVFSTATLALTPQAWFAEDADIGENDGGSDVTVVAVMLAM